MREHTLINLVRRMQGQPVTTCDECGRSCVGPDDAPPSPLFIAMFDGGIREDMQQSFCSWECAASWFVTRAGGQLVCYAPQASTQPREPREKRQPSPALSPALAERDRKIAELEARKGVIDPATLAQELAQAKVQLAQARARIAELEARGEQPEAGADAADREAEIAALKDENYKFRVELEARNYVIKTRNGGGLTKAQFRMLQQCCHPDNSASKETRDKAIRLINQLGYVLCNEAELPSMDPQKFSTWARQLWVRRQQGIKEVNKYAKRRGQPKPSPRSPKNLPKA